MRNLLCLAFVLTAATACKSKSSSPPPPPEPAKPVEPIKPADPVKPVEPPKPAAAAVTLAKGEAPLGCLAWSSSLKAAACVTGSRSMSEADLELRFVGGNAPAIELPAGIDDATAATANAALAKDGFAAFDGAPVKLEADKAHEIGAGVTLTWTRKETKAQGENQPATHANKISATCGGADKVLLEDEAEGDAPAVTVRTAGGYTVVELAIHIAREGEQSDSVEVAVLDNATCQVALSSK